MDCGGAQPGHSPWEGEEQQENVTKNRLVHRYTTRSKISLAQFFQYRVHKNAIANVRDEKLGVALWCGTETDENREEWPLVLQAHGCEQRAAETLMP